MKVGFIGLGAMGRPMAASLQRAGHDLQVHDLRRVEGFANFRSSVAEAAKDCEVLFTSLPGPAEVEAVASQVHSAKAWFDLSTNSPQTVRRLYSALAQKNIHLLDAPVSGGPRGAESGKLAIWVGGDAEVFKKYEGVLRQIGDQPYYVGPIGAGTVAKLAHLRRGIGAQVEPRFHGLDLWRDGRHLGRARQRGEQNLAIFGGFCDGRSEICETLHGPQVVHLQVMAGALQAGGHRPAHRAQADEADLHTPRSLNTSFAISAAVPPFGQPA